MQRRWDLNFRICRYLFVWTTNQKFHSYITRKKFIDYIIRCDYIRRDITGSDHLRLMNRVNCRKRDFNSYHFSSTTIGFFFPRENCGDCDGTLLSAGGGGCNQQRHLAKRTNKPSYARRLINEYIYSLTIWNEEGEMKLIFLLSTLIKIKVPTYMDHDDFFNILRFFSITPFSIQIKININITYTWLSFHYPLTSS